MEMSQNLVRLWKSGSDLHVLYELKTRACGQHAAIYLKKSLSYPFSELPGIAMHSQLSNKHQSEIPSVISPSLVSAYPQKPLLRV